MVPALSQLRPPIVPAGPASIQKGTPLKVLLGPQTVECLALNLRYVHRAFEAEAFYAAALDGLEPLELMQRGQHVARAMRAFLPQPYEAAVEVLLESFTPSNAQEQDLGLGVFFYLPHSFFFADYGLDATHNAGRDPFAVSMRALHALTSRFTSEFAIRPYLITQQDRTLAQVQAWMTDSDPHVRRLCSEGTRPKLPWGKRLPAFIKDPTPTLPLLEALKNDESLYVRRSVANHLGDIAKDHPDLAYRTCERWLKEGASTELKWVVRHALRHPAKKGDERALAIRGAAK
jgi:3-methyladenine DNA glycosylase AlkC